MRTEEKSNQLVDSVYQNLKTIKKVSLNILKGKEKIREAIEEEKFSMLVLSILVISFVTFVGFVLSAITVSQIIPKVSNINNDIQNGLTPIAALMGTLTGKDHVEITNTEKSIMAQKIMTQNLQENENMYIETDSSGDQVPIPQGYVGSKVTGENEIDTGYVIYEGTEEVNDSNVEAAKKERNQYVWIPVRDINKFYGIDGNGKKWGKLYGFTTSTGSNIDSVTGAQPHNWTESNGIMSLSSKTNGREPDVVPGSGSSGYDTDYRLKSLGLGETTTHEWLIQLEKEYNQMLESVEKYGGFYIGRYETGGLNGTTVIKKGDTNIASQTWYTMYKKCKTLKGENDSVVTGMAWGSQFDRTLAWLVETGNKTKEQICKDSIDWGNYYNNSIEYVNSSGTTVTTTENSSTRIPTGSSEQTKANNIYDLAGKLGLDHGG